MQRAVYDELNQDIRKIRKSEYSGFCANVGSRSAEKLREFHQEFDQKAVGGVLHEGRCCRASG